MNDGQPGPARCSWSPPCSLSPVLLQDFSSRIPFDSGVLDWRAGGALRSPVPDVNPSDEQAVVARIVRSDRIPFEAHCYRVPSYQTKRFIWLQEIDLLASLELPIRCDQQWRPILWSHNAHTGTAPRPGPPPITQPRLDRSG